MSSFSDCFPNKAVVQLIYNEKKIANMRQASSSRLEARICFEFEERK